MTSREPRWTGSPRARAALVGFVVLLGAPLPGGHAWAEKSAPALYQWTDERGNVRYTPDPSRVPSSQRGTLQRLEPGMPPPSAAPQPAAQPAQPAAPSAVVAPIAPAPSALPAPAPAPAVIPAPASASAPAAAPAAAAPPVATPSPPPAPTAAAASTPAPTPTLAPTPTPAPDLIPAPSPSPAPIAAALPASAPPSAPPSSPAPGDDAREQELTAAIAADEAALKELISAPIAPGDPPLSDSAQLREIARRLPELQAELSALRERRAPPAGP
jgi:hypothetical protein